jgi:5-methylcytosine-specific restriction endonuclease McrA
LNCELCEKEFEKINLTKHHLVPKQVKNRHPEKNTSETILLCSTCHKQIHATLPEKELAKNFYTLEKLKNHPKISAFIKWIQKRNPSNLKVKRSWK